MASFRTSSVFRFTRDFELLKRIIKDGIVPNYCEEDLSFGSQEFCVGIPMASFCDIPITLLDEHTNRYGNYGIALSKDWAIKQGITPVMYIANEIVLQSVFYYHQQNQNVLDLINQEDLVRDPIDNSRQMTRFFKEMIGIFKAKEEHSINTHIIGYLKKYMGVYKSKPINNYEENEWRFLVPDEDGTRWFWFKDEFKNWRFPNGNMEAAKPSPSNALKRHTLTFAYNDISYILLKDDEFKSRVINYIKKLNTIGGKEIKSDDQRDEVICKLITLDQVKKDF